MDVHINPEHQPLFARMQHVGEHLASERARLEAELRYVMQQAQRLESETMALMQRTYGIDASKQRVTLDMARGVIVLPDVQPATAEVAAEVTAEVAAEVTAEAE